MLNVVASVAGLSVVASTRGAEEETLGEASLLLVEGTFVKFSDTPSTLAMIISLSSVGSTYSSVLGEMLLAERVDGIPRLVLTKSVTELYAVLASGEPDDETELAVVGRSPISRDGTEENMMLSFETAAPVNEVSVGTSVPSALVCDDVISDGGSVVTAALVEDVGSDEDSCVVVSLVDDERSDVGNCLVDEICSVVPSAVATSVVD